MSTWMSKSKLYKRVCTCVGEAEHGTLNILNTHCQSKSSSWEKISTERPISKKIKWIWKCPISEVVNVKIKIKIKTIQECLYKALSIFSTHCQCPVFAVIAPLTRNKQYGNDDPFQFWWRWYLRRTGSEGEKVCVGRIYGIIFELQMNSWVEEHVRGIGRKLARILPKKCRAPSFS